MKVIKIRILLLNCLFISFATSNYFAQQTVNHHADFNSGQQNMWGPSFSPVTIDQTITLFDVPWSVNENTGNSGIFTVAGQSFGGAFEGSFSGRLGSEIRIEGFTTGTVEVNYPVDIELNMTPDLTYDQGDDVGIGSNYELRSGWDLDTDYPSAGEFFWDLYFEFAASASATLCAFGCQTFPIIPSFSTGLQTLNLVTISGNGASTGGDNGVWYLGYANYGGGDQPGLGFWPYAKPPATSSSSPLDEKPWQVYIPLFPAEIPDFGFGISGGLTIPYVETDSVLDPNDNSLSACGDSTYFNVNLEIFQLIGGILGEIPEPNVQAVGELLSNLSGSHDIPIPGVANPEVTWNFFSASFDGNIHNNQCFYFDPKIYGKYEFPIPVDYSVTNSNGTTATQTGTIVHFEVGDSVNYKFPCYSDSMPITPTYSIDGQFRNHTYDSVSFDFLMSAFAFGFEVPQITIVPSITVPPICVPYAYPCPTWSKPWRWCTGSACTPEYTTPWIGFPAWSLSAGPLWEHAIPLGGFTYNWFDQTWSLEGFQDTTFNAFSMVPNRLEISSTKDDVSCYGDDDGIINVSVSSVSPATPYEYTITNGITQTGGENITFTGLEAAGHVVTVTDANGCQLVTGETIQEPQPINTNYSVDDVSCNGLTDGQIAVNVTGGTGLYTYDWSNGDDLPTAGDLAAGTYTVNIIDENLCSETLEATVEEPNVLSYIASVDDVDCFGEETGSIQVNTVGGTLPYSYSWSNGSTSQNLNGLQANSYTLVVTDANNCEVSNTHIVDQPGSPVAVSLDKIDVSCFNGTDGEITSMVSGGVGPYTYQWSNVEQGVLPYTTPNISDIQADEYALTIQDNNGCLESESIVVEMPSTPISDNPSIVNVDCFGNNTGQINPNIQGGTAPYNFFWSNTTTTELNSNIQAGQYDLDVIDNNGCEFNVSYFVDQPEDPISINLSGTDILCHGDATGSVTANVQGGTPNYTFNWSNGSNSQNIENLTANSYTLEVVDNNGCVEIETQVVEEPAQPLSLSANVTDVNCHGENTGEVEMIPQGGTSPYSYSWSNDGSLISSTTTGTLTNQLAGNYTTIVTDNNGCIETMVNTIEQPLQPINIEGVITDVDCHGNSTGSIIVNTTGGTPGYDFSWSDGSTNENLINTISGTHVLTVIDDNSCVEEKSFTVKQPDAPLMTNTIPKHVLCFGQSNGSINSFTTGGTMPYTFSWSNGVNTANQNSLPADNYSLTVEDDNGCIAFSGTQIQEPDEIIITPDVLDASCFGYSDGEIVVDITGGVLPYRMTWGNQDQILLNNPSETLSGLPAKDYLIRIRDENDCLREEFISVGQPDTFMVEGSVVDVSCFEGEDGSISLDIIGGTAPYDVDWSAGLSGENINNLTADTYSYVVTDDQDCIVRGEKEVTQPDEITIHAEVEEPTCVDQSDGSIFTVIYGGTPPYSFEWSNGSTNSNLEQAAPGDYTFTVYDDEMCTNEFEFFVPINESECIIIPNTFTPNGDNYNDTWVLGNLELYPNAEVKVFNKWGNELFSSEGLYDPWDGTFDGNELPSAVYYYIIYLNNEENNKYTGTVTIVR